MKVLLTGGSGFLGRHVLRGLLDRGIEVVVLGRAPIAGHEAASFLRVDLLREFDLTHLLADVKATHLLHLAWYVEHGQFWTAPVNLDWVSASVRLVQSFCQAGGRHVVVAGSCAEYDWSHGYCREDHTPLRPGTLYGTAKDATRRLLEPLCAQYQASFAWGRIFLTFGAGESTQRLIPSIINVFCGRRQPFAVNAASYRDFMHVSDVAEGFIHLLCSNVAGAYNISSGQPVRLEALIVELARQLRRSPEDMLALAIPDLVAPNLLVGENQKLQIIGWRQQYEFSRALELTIRDFDES